MNEKGMKRLFGDLEKIAQCKTQGHLDEEVVVPYNPSFGGVTTICTRCNHVNTRQKPTDEELKEYKKQTYFFQRIWHRAIPLLRPLFSAWYQ